MADNSSHKKYKLFVKASYGMTLFGISHDVGIKIYNMDFECSYDALERIIECYEFLLNNCCPAINVRSTLKIDFSDYILELYIDIRTEKGFVDTVDEMYASTISYVVHVSDGNHYYTIKRLGSIYHLLNFLRDTINSLQSEVHSASNG